MSDALAYLAMAFVASTFLSGAWYYALLFMFKAELKRSEAEIGSLSRLSAKPFETELMTSYRVLTSRDPNFALKPGTSESKLASAAKRQLYIPMTMFMILLAAGLYVSINK